ncbi:MAG: T9SS type A sorting domain-containing protein, partial [Calditrichaeota bacterium]|nr:T9SS type A sorting domain-containing protein [Calditrichota bacterium]
LSGRLVSQLINGRQEAGVHAAIVKADDWASGLYFVRLEAGREVFTRKVMLVR